MGDTKERILQVALDLFAQKGYEGVSVSDIAGALGMTKGALYRHYENKQAIFDGILPADARKRVQNRLFGKQIAIALDDWRHAVRDDALKGRAALECAAEDGDHR